MEQFKKNTQYQILIVDDNLQFASQMKAMLSIEFDVTTASCAKEAMNILKTKNINLILLDYSMPVTSGYELLKILKKREHREIPVIMLTGKSDSETIIQTMRAGATDFVIKGSEDFETTLKFRIFSALDKIAIINKNKKLTEIIQSQSKRFEIRGTSNAVEKLKSDISKLKGSSLFVLITGENGTGKELIARNLNSQEEDPSRPFIIVNCAALTPSLFESELFGHAKGAFTGATENKTGKFQAADGGDIFLDEIGEISIELQAKLLRVIEYQVFTPVGSNQEVSINIRVIAATNVNIPLAIIQGKFREDLYHRLNQFPIRSPRLQERKDDILPLAEIFLKRELPMFKFAEEAKKALINNSWPGNIRELKNIIEKSVILAKGADRPIIRVEHLALEISNERPTQNSIFIPSALLPKSESEISAEGLQDCLDWAERTYIECCLDVMKNDNAGVFTKLGISRSNYYRRKKALGLTTDQEEGLTDPELH